jgi:opacity protein-like surface antigen
MKKLAAVVALAVALLGPAAHADLEIEKVAFGYATDFRTHYATITYPLVTLNLGDFHAGTSTFGALKFASSELAPYAQNVLPTVGVGAFVEYKRVQISIPFLVGPGTARLAPCVGVGYRF